MNPVRSPVRELIVFAFRMREHKCLLVNLETLEMWDDGCIWDDSHISDDFSPSGDTRAIGLVMWKSVKEISQVTSWAYELFTDPRRSGQGCD